MSARDADEPRFYTYLPLIQTLACLIAVAPAAFCGGVEGIAGLALFCSPVLAGLIVFSFLTRLTYRRYGRFAASAQVVGHVIATAIGLFMVITTTVSVRSSRSSTAALDYLAVPFVWGGLGGPFFSAFWIAGWMTGRNSDR